MAHLVHLLHHEILTILAEGGRTEEAREYFKRSLRALEEHTLALGGKQLMILEGLEDGKEPWEERDTDQDVRNREFRSKFYCPDWATFRELVELIPVARATGLDQLSEHIFRLARESVVDLSETNQPFACFMLAERCLDGDGYARSIL